MKRFVHFNGRRGTKSKPVRLTATAPAQLHADTAACQSGQCQNSCCNPGTPVPKLPFAEPIEPPPTTQGEGLTQSAFLDASTTAGDCQSTVDAHCVKKSKPRGKELGAAMVSGRAASSKMAATCVQVNLLFQISLRSHRPKGRSLPIRFESAILITTRICEHPK